MKVITIDEGERGASVRATYQLGCMFLNIPH